MSKPLRGGKVSGHHHEAVAPPQQDQDESCDVQQLELRITSVKESISWADERIDMAATATTATHLLHIGHPQSSPFSCRHSKRISAGGFSYAFPTTSSSKSLMMIILASRKDDSSFNNKVTPSDPAPFNSQGKDLKYVLKLAGGSVLGAAVIKYGSALFPDITTPNILLALSMICAPVILALLLLINESRAAN